MLICILVNFKKKTEVIRFRVLAVVLIIFKSGLLANQMIIENSDEKKFFITEKKYNYLRADWCQIMRNKIIRKSHSQILHDYSCEYFIFIMIIIITTKHSKK